MRTVRGRHYLDGSALLCLDCYFQLASAPCADWPRKAETRARADRVDAESPLKLVSPPLAQGCSLLTSAHRLSVVNRTARYIADNLGEPIKLEDMSRAAGMSKFHLHRVFEQNVGTTLGRYLSDARLRAALHLVLAKETRTKSVLEVALQVGFEDASAFSRSFQRRYGLTPSSLRQGNRPREFALLPASTEGARLEPGMTIVSLPEFWCYGYEVRGQKYKTFTQEAPNGFRLAWDAIRRHGIEGIQGDLGLPNSSWLVPEEACTLVCGFRSSARLGLRGMNERLMRSGKWLRARHTGEHATRWQPWARLQLQQLRLGRPQDGRRPFEEVVEYDPHQPERTGCDVYFPC